MERQPTIESLRDDATPDEIFAAMAEARQRAIATSLTLHADGHWDAHVCHWRDEKIDFSACYLLGEGQTAGMAIRSAALKLERAMAAGAPAKTLPTAAELVEKARPWLDQGQASPL